MLSHRRISNQALADTGMDPNLPWGPGLGPKTSAMSFEDAKRYEIFNYEIAKENQRHSRDSTGREERKDYSTSLTLGNNEDEMMPIIPASLNDIEVHQSDGNDNTVRERASKKTVAPSTPVPKSHEMTTTVSSVLLGYDESDRFQEIQFGMGDDKRSENSLLRDLYG